MHLRSILDFLIVINLDTDFEVPQCTDFLFQMLFPPYVLGQSNSLQHPVLRHIQYVFLV